MSKKVLIVDGEPNIVISLEFLMKQAGYDIRTAHDGKSAGALLETFSPDLALVDVMLPHRSGFELCQMIREHTEWQHIKVILLTAKSREMDITKGLALGADDYVTKPFATRDLLEKIDQMLS